MRYVAKLKPIEVILAEPNLISFLMDDTSLTSDERANAVAELFDFIRKYNGDEVFVNKGTHWYSEEGNIFLGRFEDGDFLFEYAKEYDEAAELRDKVFLELEDELVNNALLFPIDEDSSGNLIFVDDVYPDQFNEMAKEATVYINNMIISAVVAELGEVMGLDREDIAQRISKIRKGLR